MISNVDYAVFAMDSYNTTMALPEGMAGSGQWEEISLTDSEFTANSVGFSARAYRKGSEVVISYRGSATAEIEDGSFLNEDYLSDWWGSNRAFLATSSEGFFLGPPASGLPNQLWDAYQFAEAVKNNVQQSDPNTTFDFSYTGHSLGGGLATLIAGREGAKAVVFDPAPTGGLIDQMDDYLYFDVLDNPGFPDLVPDTNGRVLPPNGQPVNTSNITNITLFGESISQDLTSASDFAGTEVFYNGSRGDSFDSVYLNDSEYQVYDPFGYPIVNYLAQGDVQRGLHSMGPLAILLQSEADNLNLEEIVEKLPRVMPQLTNNAVSGMQIPGKNEVASFVFTKELFWDARGGGNLLTKLAENLQPIADASVISTARDDKEASTALVQIVIQYIRDLMVQKKAGNEIPPQQIVVREGDYLKVDLSQGSGNEPWPTNAVIEGKELLVRLADEGLITGTTGALNVGEAAQAQNVTQFVVAASGGATTLLVGSNDHNDFIYGGIKDDTIEGKDKEDLLYGADGDDILRGGKGDDILVGGKGVDTADYSQAAEGVTIELGNGGPLGVFERVTTVTSDGDGGSDKLFEVERIVGSSKDDVVKVIGFDNNELGNFEFIDLAGGVDTLDFSQHSGAVIVNLYDSQNQFAKSAAGGREIKLRNVEGVVGTNESDEIIGGDGQTTIDGGAGDDVLGVFGGPGTVIHTGSGEDTVVWSAGVLVTDANGEDRISFFGTGLEGALKSGASESAWAHTLGGLVKIGFNSAGEMVIGTPLFSAPGTGLGNEDASYMYLANGNNDPFAASADLTAGIRVAGIEVSAYRLLHLPSGVSLADNAGMWDFMALTLKEFFSEHRVAGADPLVLDLDGDGIELTAVSAVAPNFDIDGDKFAEPTGWVGADDGFLAIDLDSNGKIDDVGELFGSAQQSGFAQLAAYDTNLDGVIDINDTQFGDLRVWQDLNQDGVTGAGELKTLAELDIASINLTATDTNTTNALNTVVRTGTFTQGDGTTGEVGDVEFRIDNFNTTYTGDTTVDPTIAATMPNLKGHGTLTDLHVALTLETGGALATAINTALPTLNVIDLAALRANAMPIFEAWTTALPGQAALTNPDVPILVEDTENGNVVRDFAVEVTEDIDNGDGTFTTVTYWKLASGAAVSDGIGGTIQYPTFAEVLAQIDADPNKTWQNLTGAELNFLERYIGEDIPIEDARALNSGAVSALSSLLTKTTEILDALALRLASQGPLSTYFTGIEYDVEDDTFKPTSDRQLIPMFEAIFTAAPADTPGAESWLESWEPLIDALLADYERGGHLQNSFNFIFGTMVAAYEIVGPNIGIVSAATKLGIPENLIVTGAGTIDGTAENDIFYMDGTDQVARGGEGFDAYVFGRNFGTDVIEDIEAFGTDRQPDMIRFADYAPTDLTFVRDGIDLIIKVNGTNHQVTVKKQFEGRQPGLFGGDFSDDTGVAEIVFADGTVYDRVDIAKAVADPRATSDTYIGTDEIDFLDGGAGNDRLEGGNETDIYKFGTGYGHDTVKDGQDNILLNGDDFVQFGQGLTVDDLTFTRNGDSDDLVVTITATGETLTVERQFVAYNTGVFGLKWLDRIEIFMFEDGSYLTWDNILEKVVRDAKTDGDDQIYGFYYQDVLDGGAGNDFLSGGDEGDTYIFGKMYGHDVIDDGFTNVLTQTPDKVSFNADVAPGDVVFSRVGDSLDLVISFTDDDSTLTIKDQFSARYTGPFGKQWFNRVEIFEFSDSTVMTWDQIIPPLVSSQATAGNDVIYGFAFEDTLDGGAGDDLLIGGEENDVYVFGRGYGNDVIDEQRQNILSGSKDIVQFNPDVAPSDIILERSANTKDLLIKIAGTTDTLLIKNTFRVVMINLQIDYIEEFHFSDGTVWTLAEVRDMVMAAENTSGDDHVRGFQTDDTIDGGAGNDLLDGMGGDDTYVYGRGYGNDVIHDNRGVRQSTADVVEFKADIAPGDLTVTRDGDDVVFTITDTGETLRVKQQFHYNILGQRGWEIEEFKFTDGTIWTPSDLQVMLLQGTAGDDTIEGFASADVLDGGAGNDTLIGGDGSDTYHFGVGGGQDVIEESDWILGTTAGDRLILGAGIEVADLELNRVGTDLTIDFVGSTDKITIKGHFHRFGDTSVEFIEFADGTVWDVEEINNQLIGSSTSPGDDEITGTDGADTIDGGTGNDLLSGELGGDTYIFGRGYGQDVIDDRVISLGNGQSGDRVVFNADVAPADIELERSGNDLIMRITGTTDQLTIVRQFYRVSSTLNTDRIETFEFSDGTVWTAAEVDARVLAEAATDGDDIIHGHTSDDLMTGGAGNDILTGEEGLDTYVFGRGYGQDVIDEMSGGNGWNGDKVLFTADVQPEELKLARDGNDLVIWIPGTEDQLTIHRQFYSTNTTLNNDRIELFEFADGTVWSAAEVDARMIAQSITTGDDTVVGFTSDDVLDGGLGNDLLTGEGGKDTYIFGRGYGQDTINEVTSTGSNGQSGDKVQFRLDIAPDDLVLTRVGSDLVIEISGTTDSLTVIRQFAKADSLFNNDRIESFEFGNGVVWTADEIDARIIAESATDGDDTITGLSSGNVLDGGAGNDTLIGEEGGDTYVFGLGYGHDVINDIVNGPTNGQSGDKVQFGADIAPGDLMLSRSGNDLVIQISGTTDQLTITGQLYRTDSFWNNDRIESFEFADGTIWTANQMDNALLAQEATTGDDTIQALDGDETLAGGTGNDTLIGGEGSDTYHYAVGDGNDIITDDGAASPGNTDLLVLGAGLNLADMSAAKTGTHDVTLSFSGVTGSIVLSDQLRTADGVYGVEEIRFSDGSILNRVQLMDMVLGLGAAITGTAGNDTVAGTDQSETLNALAGNDDVDGGSGSDTYLYALGDGTDVFRDNGTVYDVDTLKFTDLNVADLEFDRSEDGNDLIITVKSNSETVTFENHFVSNAQDLETIEFADGTIWDQQQILIASSLLGTPGDDTLIGTSISEYIIGGQGDDDLQGKGGNDTYLYNLGDGHDVIYDYGSSNNTDRLILGEGLNSTDVILVRSTTDVDDMTLSFNGIAGSITLNEQFYSESRDIDEIHFGDGVIWDKTKLQTEYLAQVSTDGNDTILAFWGIDDVITGGLGNDDLQGWTGSDTYIYNLGDGDDVIYDNGSASNTDRLLLGAGLNSTDVILTRSTTDADDMTLSFNGVAGSIMLNEQFYSASRDIDEITFGDGVTWDKTKLRLEYLAQVSTDGDDTILGFYYVGDTLQGGLGNDDVQGWAGSDTYIYNLGDGDDVIYDTGLAGDTDKLILGTGLDSTNVTLTRSTTDADDITLTFGGIAGSIMLNEQFRGTTYGIDEITFGDGVVWTKSDVQTNYLTQVSTAGNDTIVGFDSNDTIDGGAGNDDIQGGYGADTYIYNQGDGDDIIYDLGYTWDTDKLILGTGLDSTNVTLTRSTADPDDVTLTFGGVAGSIMLNEQFRGASYGIDEITFGDGVVWTKSDVQTNYLAQVSTAGNDTIVGFDSNDTIDGGAGNDDIRGGYGADTYIYDQGDGDDIVYDLGYTSDTDKLILGTGLDSTNASLTRSLTDHDDVTLTFDGLSGSIMLNEQFRGASYGIEEITFGDGVTWDKATILANTWFRGTAGDDVLGGTSAADNFDAGAGNDTLTGAGGSDVFLFSPSLGQDTITDFQAGAGSDDVIRLQGLSVSTLADVLALTTQSGSDAVITFDANNAITLTGVDKNNLHEDDFQFA